MHFYVKFIIFTVKTLQRKTEKRETEMKIKLFLCFVRMIEFVMIVDWKAISLQKESGRCSPEVELFILKHPFAIILLVIIC